MRRLNDDEVVLTNSELNDIREFIRDSLYREWDAYTDRVITNKPREEIMREMNPAMYDFADAIVVI